MKELGGTSKGFLLTLFLFRRFMKVHVSTLNHLPQPKAVQLTQTGGQAMENLTAKDIMNRDVLTVNEDLSIQGLAEFLFLNSISGAPVISRDGK
jgi:CBS domain-containing protein